MKRFALRWSVLSLVIAGTAYAAPRSRETVAPPARRVDKCARFAGEDAAALPIAAAFEMARCREKHGQITSAIASFESVAQRAGAARDRRSAARAVAARQRIVELTPRVGTIVVHANRVADVSIAIDEKSIDPARVGEAVRVDPGEHVVSASSPRHEYWATRVTVAAGEQVTASVPELREEIDPTYGAKSSVGFAIPESTPQTSPPGTDRPASATATAAPNTSAPRIIVGLGSTIALPVRSAAEGLAAVTSPSVSYALSRVTAVSARVPIVGMRSLERGNKVFVANPIVGVNSTWFVGSRWRLGLNGQVTIPVGHGADKGDVTIREVLATVRGSTQYVNYTGFGPSGSATFGLSHLSVGGRAGVTQFIRVRGSDVDKDALRTQLSGAATFGFSPSENALRAPVLFIAEARYLVWASDASPVRKDPDARDNLMGAVGARLRGRWGSGFAGGALTYAAAVDSPLVRYGYHTLDIDLELGF